MILPKDGRISTSFGERNRILYNHTALQELNLCRVCIILVGGDEARSMNHHTVLFHSNKSNFPIQYNAESNPHDQINHCKESRKPIRLTCPPLHEVGIKHAGTILVIAPSHLKRIPPIFPEISSGLP